MEIPCKKCLIFPVCRTPAQDMNAIAALSWVYFSLTLHHCFIADGYIRNRGNREINNGRLQKLTDYLRGSDKEEKHQQLTEMNEYKGADL